MLCKLSVACAMVVLISFSSAAQTPREQSALRNVKSIFVSLVMEEPAPGLDDARITLDTRQQLERGGVSLTVGGQEIGTILRISILPKYDERRKVYAVAVTLELLRPLDAFRLNGEFSTLWMRRDVLVTETWPPVRESVAQLANEFIQNWRLTHTSVK